MNQLLTEVIVMPIRARDTMAIKTPRLVMRPDFDYDMLFFVISLVGMIVCVGYAGLTACSVTP